MPNNQTALILKRFTQEKNIFQSKTWTFHDEWYAKNSYLRYFENIQGMQYLLLTWPNEFDDLIRELSQCNITKLTSALTLFELDSPFEENGYVQIYKANDFHSFTGRPTRFGELYRLTGNESMPEFEIPIEKILESFFNPALSEQDKKMLEIIFISMASLVLIYVIGLLLKEKLMNYEFNNSLSNFFRHRNKWSLVDENKTVEDCGIEVELAPEVSLSLSI